MQPYPTIQNYGFNNNPYGNQQQFQQYQPLDRLAQLQMNYQNTMPYQPQQMQSVGLNGEIVDGIDVVKAKNVSMDGSVVYYPQSNGEAIFTKQLQADGTSRILTYRVVQDVPQEQIQPTMSMEMLNGMFGQLKQDFSNEIGELKELIYSLAPAEQSKVQRGGSQK